MIKIFQLSFPWNFRFIKISVKKHNLIKFEQFSFNWTCQHSMAMEDDWGRLKKISEKTFCNYVNSHSRATNGEAFENVKFMSENLFMTREREKK